jgi:hypothetical protein
MLSPQGSRRLRSSHGRSPPSLPHRILPTTCRVRRFGSCGHRYVVTWLITPGSSIGLSPTTTGVVSGGGCLFTRTGREVQRKAIPDVDYSVG